MDFLRLSLFRGVTCFELNDGIDFSKQAGFFQAQGVGIFPDIDKQGAQSLLLPVKKTGQDRPFYEDAAGE